MKKVSITVKSDFLADGTPLVADLLDADMNMKWRGLAVVNTPVVLPETLSEGRYAIVITSPSGLRFSAGLDADATDANLDVMLHAPSAGGPASASHSPESPASDPPKSPLLRTSRPMRLQAYGRLGTTWIRFWSNDASRKWRVQSLDARALQGLDGNVFGQFRAGQLPLGQHCMQIGGGLSQPRITVVPPGQVLFVLRRADYEDSDEATGPAADVDMDLAAPEAHSLLGYLSRGDFGRAQFVGREVVTRLEEEAVSDPATVLLAAYYLLSSHDLAALENVFNQHLARWHWSPDAAVIDAWRSLRQTQPDLKKGRDQLLVAAKCGVPAFTRGLRLLLDGLRIAQDNAPTDSDVIDALRSLQQFAQAADWSRPFTTYFAVEPDKPIDPREGIAWLKDAQQAARDPNSVFPWANAFVGEGQDGKDSGDQMPTAFSVPFSRAFGYPPGYANLAASMTIYDQLRRKVSRLHEAAS
jgi:hypothetical protein